MAGLGPPPKPADQRRRRNATVAMTALPAEGRQGPCPDYPLPPPPARGREKAVRAAIIAREAVLWADLWQTPQAVMWERSRSELAVARYTRFATLAEMGDLKAATEARQLEDRLGLNPQAMLRLRWEVVEDEVAERRVDRTPTANSPRQRLRVVDPEAAHDAVAGS